MPKITKEEIQQRVFQNTLETCDYIDGYENAQSNIKIKCRKHQYEFQTKWENVRRANRAHHVCPFCIEEDKNERYKEDRVEVECAYCHNKILKPKSKLDNSKSGLYFCCREHKDLAQRLESGEQFNIMRPEHYGNILENSSDYRKKAFHFYEHKCTICGYNEEPQILQVHHIDENRTNNELDNLIILCPNCHAKITWAKYKLIDRKQIIKE